MNGDIYSISNPDIASKVQFSTEFNIINSSSEYFDIYSPPITSRYAMVYWNMMSPVPLPNYIVKRFQNKKIAIVGYEVDQVFRTNDGKEKSVPITWAYNHHYEAYLLNTYNAFEKLDNNYISENDYGQYNHGSRRIFQLLNNSIYNDNALFFSEANGGEFRASFHGYPNGYAQLLNSPTYFNIQPMQIDTRNRDPIYINDTKFYPGIMPKNSAAPKNANYSGLLECPCTTRINKTIKYEWNYQIQNTCSKIITNSTICETIGPSNFVFHNVSNSSIPYGCSFRNGNTYFNSYRSSSLCGETNSSMGGDYFGFVNDTLTNITLNINYTYNTKYANITLSGPNNVWFGVAFNATKMGDEPYSIIVDGNGHIFEQKLGNHGPGVRLNRTINVYINKIINNTRFVVIGKPEHSTNTIDNFNFNFSEVFEDMNILTAIGSGSNFAYHRLKTTNILQISSRNGYTCICNDGQIGTINGIRFQKDCLSEPRGDLIAQKNPSCFIETYQGGQSCCHHKWVLLDKDQQQPEHEMTYYLKFRFWFQEYYNQQNLIRAYYQTEAFSGEYDVPKCLKGIPPEDCIHSITARWQVIDLVDSKYIGNSSGFEIIYAAPHCHAPMCIDVELYNADTGNLICHVSGDFGKGNTSLPYDELDYIKLNPCIWGHEAGLLKPEFLSWDTNLISIKRCNNTDAHYGEMASWQMRGAIIK